jgi:predicted nucleic-acid-binding Zn-ribbon protein
MKKRCPKCGSEEIEMYDDLAFIKCTKCGYDELGTADFPYGVKKSQKEKGRYSPFKAGGSRRSKK